LDKSWYTRFIILILKMMMMMMIIIIIIGKAIPEIDLGDP
jgi:hypothetical protein